MLCGLISLGGGIVAGSLLVSGCTFVRFKDGGFTKSGEKVAGNGVITDKTNGAVFKCPALPASMAEIVEKGGLVNYVKSRLAAEA